MTAEPVLIYITYKCSTHGHGDNLYPLSAIHSFIHNLAVCWHAACSMYHVPYNTYLPSASCPRFNYSFFVNLHRQQHFHSSFVIVIYVIIDIPSSKYKKTKKNETCFINKMCMVCTRKRGSGHTINHRRSKSVSIPDGCVFSFVFHLFTPCYPQHNNDNANARIGIGLRSLSSEPVSQYAAAPLAQLKSTHISHAPASGKSPARALLFLWQ